MSASCHKYYSCPVRAQVLLQRFALVDAKNTAMMAAATASAQEARQVAGARMLLQGGGMQLLTAS